MKKRMKQLLKIVSIFLFVLSVVLLSLYFVFQSTKVQTYLSRKLAQNISEQLGTKVSIKSVDIGFFNKLILEGLYLEDEKFDTLLYVGQLNASIQSISFKNKEIALGNLIFNKSYFKMFQDSNKMMNYKYIIDFIKDSSDKKNKWAIRTEGVEVLNSFYNYERSNKEYKEKGINYRDIQVRNINLTINNIEVKDTVLYCIIKEINADEISGFKLSHFSCNLSANKHGIYLNNLAITTPLSYIFAKKYFMEYDSISAFKSYVNEIQMTSEFDASRISFRDLAFFAPKLDSIKNIVGIKGNISGNVSNLIGDNIDLSFGKKSNIKLDFHIDGLPNVKETYFMINCDEANFTSLDLNLLELPFLKDNSLNIPDNFLEMGLAVFRGSIEGDVHNFFIEGSLSSGIGSLRAQLEMKRHNSIKTSLNGNLIIDNFNIGKIIDFENNFQQVNAVSTISGIYTKNKGLFANINGTIRHLILNNYNYQNITFNSQLKGNKGNFNLKLKDTNIDLRVNSLFYGTPKDRVYTLNANLKKAQLYNLNFNDEFSNSSLRLNLYSKFTSLNLDNLVGNASINNISYKNNYGTSSIKNISLKGNLKDSLKVLDIKSDLMNANITGKYKLSSIIPVIKNIFTDYLPALKTKGEQLIRYNEENAFSYSIKFNANKEKSNVFFSGLEIEKNTTVKGEYNQKNGNFSLDINSAYVKYKNYHISGLQFSVNNYKNQLLNAFLQVNKISFGNTMSIYNIKTSSEINNNNIAINIGWEDNLNTAKKSEVKGQISFIKNKKFATPVVKINIRPSFVLIRNEIWNISESIAIIDEENIQIRNFELKSKAQGLFLESFITNNTTNNIKIDFYNLSLLNFNNILLPYNVKLDGISEGNITLLDVMKVPKVLVNLELNNLMINNNKIGDVHATTKGNNNNTILDINAYIKNNNQKNINVKGNYNTITKDISLDVGINKFNFGNIQPLLSKIFNNMDGNISGSVKVDKKISKPNFNGELYLTNTSVIIDFLKTQYYLSTPVSVINSNLIFKDTKLKDTENNIGIMNGIISHNNFKDISYEINVKTNKLQVLNTTFKDNNLYYGKVYATGTALIKGNPSDLNFIITAKSEKGTDIYIPLDNEEKISENKFVKFVKTNKKGKSGSIKKGKVDISGINLELDIQATTNANMNLIIDSKTQSAIRGTGSGNFKLIITPNKGFQMYGEYRIYNGDYIFSLENIISKKFIIEEGGLITWDGDPFKSLVNITANYGLKASPYMLAPEIIKTKKKTPVNVAIQISNKLPNPDIKFDIKLPNANTETRDLLQNYLIDPSEVNKQVLSLLLLNTFYKGTDVTNESSGTSTNGNISSITTMELLTNQFSSWISNASKNFDFGINYTPKQYEEDKTEIEVEVSTEILNDRVQISGSAGTTRQGEETNKDNITGDVDVRVKVNESGNIQLKAYSHSDDDLIDTESSSKQGVGIMYKKDFDNFGELFKSYWDKIIQKNRKEQ